MAKPYRRDNSLDTILTYDNHDAQSQWSVIWSTSEVGRAEVRGATRGGATRAGRRRLRAGALVLGAALAMHCRLPSSALSSGYLMFLLFFVISVVMLANPMRHFEVYLGQWSISGPGRAFRIIPLLDGIGVAMCVNCIVRAITFVAIAAMCAVYVLNAISDLRLPYTYCRDFNLTSYKPNIRHLTLLRSRDVRYPLDTVTIIEPVTMSAPTTVGLRELAWRNIGNSSLRDRRPRRHPQTIVTCNETYENYPAYYRTPAYNYFYVQLVHLRSTNDFSKFNTKLLVFSMIFWALIWLILVGEISWFGRILWNEMPAWLIIIPGGLALLLMFVGVASVRSYRSTIHAIFDINIKDIADTIGNALEVALYTHSAGTGTEIIYGKILNRYASGHIDPNLNNDNVWHSGILLALSTVHMSAAMLCSVEDQALPKLHQGLYETGESTLWTLPMYSNAIVSTNYFYEHFTSVLVFGSLALCYLIAAFILIKTSLHTIFEYKVRLVYVEHIAVGILILLCTGLTVIFCSHGGLALLESVDAMMTGVTTPIICYLELVCLLYLYRNRDFISDMNVATEENNCASRIGTQWVIIPFIIIVMTILKITSMSRSLLPAKMVSWSAVPLAGALLAVPLRALYNAFRYLHRNQRQRNDTK